MENDEQQRLAVGRISGVHGVRGWVKVFSYTKPRENILNYQPWYLFQAGEWQIREVEAGRVQGKGIVVKLKHCDDRDIAYQMIGIELSILRDQLPKLQADEFYWNDLTGLAVINRQGEPLGKIDHLLETGAHDVLVVIGERERLIPFVMGNTVLEVSLERREMLVDWDKNY
ncbi:MAG: ribosome maturation factor RimM [Gammaproteobacteria bacterium]